MSSEFSRPVDAWSRFVAYCSLVVALGTLCWVWLSGGDSLLGAANRNVSQTDGVTAEFNKAEFDKLFDQEAASRKQRDDEMREAWRLEQQNQLQQYKKAADEMLAEHQSLITQLNGNVQPATFTAADDAASMEVDSQSDSQASDSQADSDAEEIDAKDVADANALTDEKIAGMRPSEGLKIGDPEKADNPDNKVGPNETVDADDESAEFFSPLLSRVVTTQKTDGSNADQGIVVVRNTGSGKAILARIQFTPSNEYDAIFEVDAPISLSADSGDDVVEIIFSEQDNLAGESGKHGIYERQLFPTAFGVNGGDELRIRLAIANEKHIGWGFRGKIEISYNGPNPLVIEDAELVFVSASQPIVQK